MTTLKRQIGLLGATWPLVYSVTCLTMGKWSDRVGSMPLLRSALLLLAILVLPLALTSRSLLPLYFVAAGVGFSVRGAILGDWGDQFGFTQTVLGQITGGGLTGFGITIIICSLFVDQVG